MSRSLGVFAAGVVLATIVELGACGSSDNQGTSSSTTASSSSSSSGGGGASFGSSPCGTCIQMACSNEAAACEAEPSCSAYIECFLACPVGADGNVDAACEASCPAASGTAAQNAKDAFSYCRQAGNGGTCAQQCGLDSPDGGAQTCDKNPIVTQQCSPSNDPNQCNKCQYEKCCDSVDAVFNGGPATDLATCWLACNDYPCEKGCFDKYPDGVAGFGGYSACVAINCQIPGLCKTSSACRLCQITDCCNELADCDTDPECFLISQCVGGCDSTDLACGSACYAAHPKGQAGYAKLGVCSAQRCIDKCKL